MSAAGRPRKPVLLKALEGDTRQRGANKHAESIAAALISQRGEPDMPDWRAPNGASPEVRRRIKVAREHWQYLCRELGREGLLSTVDQGILASAAMTFAMAQEAFMAGDVRAHTEQSRTYMQIADRMGLNESARAKFPKKSEAIDPLEAALCG
jgi:phage terminase small subunit